jgi:hypothetical protein
MHASPDVLLISQIDRRFDDLPCLIRLFWSDRLKIGANAQRIGIMLSIWILTPSSLEWVISGPLSAFHHLGD